MAIWSSPVLGKLLPDSCLSPRERKRVILTKTQCHEFMFGTSPTAPASSNSHMVASVLSSLALSVGSTSFLTGASNPAASLVMSCIPIIVPMSVNRLSDSTVLTFLSEDGKNFIKGIKYWNYKTGTYQEHLSSLASCPCI